MVVIRLARSGSKKRPFYKIVAADRRFQRDGRLIESLGFYNPMARGKEETIRLSRDRLDYWVKMGAKLSQRVTNIVKTWDAEHQAQGA